MLPLGVLNDPIKPKPAAADATSVSPPGTEINPLSGIQGTNPIADALTLGKRTDPFPYHDETYKASMGQMAIARAAKELSPADLAAFGLTRAPNSPADDSVMPHKISTPIDNEVSALMSGFQKIQ